MGAALPCLSCPRECWKGSRHVCPQSKSNIPDSQCLEECQEEPGADQTKEPSFSPSTSTDWGMLGREITGKCNAGTIKDQLEAKVSCLIPGHFPQQNASSQGQPWSWFPWFPGPRHGLAGGWERELFVQTEGLSLDQQQPVQGTISPF